MNHKMRGGLWLAGALVAGAMASGCGASATTEDATTMVSQAVEASADSTDAVEVSSLMRGLHAVRSDAVEGFHCDASPDITNVEVCGKSLPATVHLEWTECAAPMRPGGGGHGGGRGDGSRPPPPGEGTGIGALSARGAPPAEGTRPEGRGRPHGGPSSGTVDITYTYSAPPNCDGAITQNQSVTFSISRTDGEGAVSKVEGTSASSAELIGDEPPRKKSTESDVTRTLTDATGAVVRSVHLKGATNVEFSSDTPPVRTLNGFYTEEFLDGTTGAVTLDSIVRPPRNVCPWPTSGTLSRTSSDGQTHVLVFGPDCGTATLDGTAVEMPARGAGRKGRH
ncbi:hypothetical protein ATI61_106539 [Archangium gephyra]|uniref:Lipoprotein n=1 Tax=Archangium gephyra TaxID=48 RepID=A0AAC8Q1C6_9BACT|nr:hypothetical protein [Archangium gephyra]AKI99163.1 Hypothetical protein AA314_00790 [Archangium gephyra]REG31069.1 hypothetical protein ATI61_106539 [Archangium gephyra]